MNQHYSNSHFNTIRFPTALLNIQEYCTDNPTRVPYPMVLDQKTWSNQDEPMAIYRCNYSGRRSGWVVHRKTGQPHRLWTKPGNR